MFRRKVYLGIRYLEVNDLWRLQKFKYKLAILKFGYFTVCLQGIIIQKFILVVRLMVLGEKDSVNINIPLSIIYHTYNCIFCMKRSSINQSLVLQLFNISHSFLMQNAFITFQLPFIPHRRIYTVLQKLRYNLLYCFLLLCIILQLINLRT